MEKKKPVTVEDVYREQLRQDEETRNELAKQKLDKWLLGKVKKISTRLFKKYAKELRQDVLKKGIKKLPEQFDNMLFSHVRDIVKLADLQLTIERLNFYIEVQNIHWKVYYFIKNGLWVGTCEDLDASSQGRDFADLYDMMREVIEHRLRCKNSDHIPNKKTVKAQENVEERKTLTFDEWKNSEHYKNWKKELDKD